MAERIVTPSYSGSETQTITLDEVDNKPEDVAEVQLTVRKPKTDKGVKWRPDTVDNEHLNRKKSKCCCIYEKPRNFGESSSESDDECENCFGHVELKKKRKMDKSEGETSEASIPSGEASTNPTSSGGGGDSRETGPSPGQANGHQPSAASQ